MRVQTSRQDPAGVELAIVADSVRRVPEVADSNSKKLVSCALPHKFVSPNRGSTHKVETWKCAQCGGVVTDEARTWYNLGLLHGLQTENPKYPDTSADGRRSNSGTRA